MSKKLTLENSLGYKEPKSIQYWSDKNTTTPYDHFLRETTKVWWKCGNGIHKDYLRSCDGSYQKHYRCPHCSNAKQWKETISKDESTFEAYCKSNDLLELLSLWDYELNDLKPCEIGPHSSKQKIWFKCPRSLHGSHLVSLNNLCRSLESAKRMNICPECNSIGQAIIDEYGKDYLDSIWSDKNEKSYFKIPRSGKTKIWLKCLTDKTHPDYDLLPSNFFKTHNCPYCSSKRVCHTNSLGYKFPQSIDKWSDKNEKSPFEYTPSSKEKVWWKCENHKHDDYQQVICNASGLYDFRCPECGRENQVHPSGPDAPNWKGGITPEIKRIRKSEEYKNWRTKVYESDDYLCQCCLNPKNNRLRAHHIQSFSSHEDLRFDVLNGITLCTKCHDATEYGGFHNLYGTKDKTPEELQEYINNKRKQLGILIPFKIDEYIKQKKTHRLDDWLESINTDSADPDWSESLLFQPKEETDEQI